MKVLGIDLEKRAWQFAKAAGILGGTVVTTFVVDNVVDQLKQDSLEFLAQEMENTMKE